jgi:beta-lactamase class A
MTRNRGLYLKVMIRDWYVGTKHHFRLNWKLFLIFMVAAAVIITILAQLVYPASRLLPFTTVDSIAVGGKNKSDVVKQVDTAYSESTINVYFSNATKPYRSSPSKDIGLNTSNNDRIQAMNYPWYLRIVPSSLLWAHFIVKPTDNPTFNHDNAVLTNYIATQFGQDCSIVPQDATLSVNGVTLQVVPSSPGGTCNTNDLTTKLQSAKPTIGSPTRIAISGKELPASVSDSAAQQLADHITSVLKNGVGISVGGDKVTVPATELFSWLDVTTTGGKLDYSFNVDRASTYLDANVAPKMAVKPGVTTVTTSDFAEISRVTGPSGQTLDEKATLDTLKTFVAGNTSKVIAITQLVAPTIDYTRSYSATDTGLSALIQNYASSHVGTYGVSIAELSGARRHATYQADTQFTTASTYKLFVAYSTLLRIESGSWQWSDQIQGGYSLSQCFDRMIRLSDNDCASALLIKIGFQEITNEAHAAGANNTSFLGNDGIKSTAADEALLLSELQSGQILAQQSNRDVWINALKSNVYRQGIPAGIPSAIVADKVGFLDTLLHDAAIVYSPSGTYVLVIMTDNASWTNIAELASQIETLRN